MYTKSFKVYLATNRVEDALNLLSKAEQDVGGPLLYLPFVKHFGVHSEAAKPFVEKIKSLGWTLEQIISSKILRTK